MAKTLCRTAAVVAVAGVMLTGAATAASATDKAATSLSIRLVNAQNSSTISGSLHQGSAPVQGAVVSLAAEPAGATRFTVVRSDHTGQNGGVAFSVSPAKTTRYRLVFSGDASRLASHSGVVSVRGDGRMASSLSIRSALSSINPGGKDNISGVLRGNGHVLAGRHVDLVAGSPGSWRTLGTKTTGQHGWVGFTVSPAATQHYMLVFRGGSSFRPSRSGIVTVIVRKATSLSIRSGASSVAPGGSTTISGVLLSEGNAVAGRTVSLLSRPASGGDWAVVQTATTGDHGGVDFTVSPTSKTQYELHFATTPRFLRSTSGVVTVDVA
ncbi:MAG: hypothetical protein QOE84_1216 [Actinomycetota bacterium]|jgi:hypothetical protein|nr:hypothetical protein [Actinomycetota bacterium]